MSHERPNGGTHEVDEGHDGSLAPLAEHGLSGTMRGSFRL